MLIHLPARQAESAFILFFREIPEAVTARDLLRDYMRIDFIWLRPSLLSFYAALRRHGLEFEAYYRAGGTLAAGLRPRPIRLAVGSG